MSSPPGQQRREQSRGDGEPGRQAQPGSLSLGLVLSLCLIEVVQPARGAARVRVIQSPVSLVLFTCGLAIPDSRFTGDATFIVVEGLSPEPPGPHEERAP
jgi:hypothetical protein